MNLLKFLKSNQGNIITLKNLKTQTAPTAAELKKINSCLYTHKVNRMTWQAVDIKKALKALQPAAAKKPAAKVAAAPAPKAEKKTAKKPAAKKPAAKSASKTKKL